VQAFWTALLFSAFLGTAMSYVVLLCSTVNSPLATSITGNVKDIGASILGAVLFGDFKATFASLSGLLISFFGAGIFSVAKVQETRANAATANAASAAASSPQESSNGGAGAVPAMLAPSGGGDIEDPGSPAAVHHRKQQQGAAGGVFWQGTSVNSTAGGGASGDDDNGYRRHHV
jgi:hypothetical protein